LWFASLPVAEVGLNWMRHRLEIGFGRAREEGGSMAELVLDTAASQQVVERIILLLKVFTKRNKSTKVGPNPRVGVASLEDFGPH
jgi:hypothetical protein